MQVDVTNTIEIDRPVAVVAAYAMDPDKAPEWYQNIKSIEWRTPRPLVVGTQLDFVAHFLGRRLAYTYEVVELAPGGMLVMRTAQGPFPMETSYSFQALGPGRTRMTLRNRGTPSRFAAVMAPAMSAAMHAANRKDLRAIKAILERS